MHALRLLLAFFVMDLTWEVLRANLDAPQRTQWPWRLTILDPATCATLAALLTGILVTRNQYALSTLPLLSWAAHRGNSDYIVDSPQTVRLCNAGGGRAVVKRVEYRLQESPRPDEPNPRLSPWLDWYATIAALKGIGLRMGQDIHVLELGKGAVIPLTARPSDGIELVSFGARGLERLDHLDMRIQVVDALGDVHERMLQCRRRRPDPSRQASLATDGQRELPAEAQVTSVVQQGVSTENDHR